MAARVLKKLKEKGCTILARTASPEEWDRLIQDNPDVPKTFGALLSLANFEVYGGVTPDFLRDTDEDDECGIYMYDMIDAGLTNPFLTDQEIDEIDEVLADEEPPLPDKKESDHFLIKYNSDPISKHYFSHELVEQVVSVLESSYGIYTQKFGRAPYLCDGKSIYDVSIYSFAPRDDKRRPPPLGRTSPDRPISLNADRLRGQCDWRLIYTTPAHELFHRVQFAFGFKTKIKSPKKPYAWFSEGSASWAAMFASNLKQGLRLPHVKNEQIICWYLDQQIPGKAFFEESSYKAVPLWIYIQTRMNMGCPPKEENANEVLTVFQRYEALALAPLDHPDAHFKSVPATTIHGFSDFLISIAANVWRNPGYNFRERLAAKCDSYSSIYSAHPDDDGKAISMIAKPSTYLELGPGDGWSSSKISLRPFEGRVIEFDNRFCDGKSCTLRVRLQRKHMMQSCRVTLLSHKGHIYEYFKDLEARYEENRTTWVVDRQQSDKMLLIVVCTPEYGNTELILNIEVSD
jgi:hypothetical protein